MKKLKIISLCFLISIFLIPNVKASGTYNFVPMNSNVINTYLSNHTGSTSQDFYDMIIENLEYSSTYNNYVCLFYLGNGGVDCYSTEADFKLFAGITGYGGRPSLQLLLPQGDRVETSYSITFNNIGDYVSHTSYTSTPNYFSSLSLTNNSSTLNYIPIISNNSTILYDNSYPSANTYYDSFSFNSLVTYSVNNEVNLSDFGIGTNYIASVYDSLSNPYKCTVNPNGFRTSSLSNISDFEYRITADNLSSEDYGIEGSFAFQNSSFSLSDNNFNSSDYWETEVIKGPDSVGEYNVNGVLSWDDTTKVLTVNYGVYATGSEPAKVDAIIKLIPKVQYSKDYFSGTLNYYSCNPTNPDIFLNDSYGYTDNTTGLTNSYDTSLMNFLKTTSKPDLQIFNNMKSLLPPGPVDSILTIPLQMLSAINNFLGSNCQPLNINLPFINRNVELKCIRSFYSDIGATTFVEGVGSIASVIILVQYFVGLYNWIDSNIQITHNKLKSWGAGEV